MSPADRGAPGLGAVLEQTTLAAHHAAFEYADRRCAPDLATARADTWRLVHLLGALSDLSTGLAAYTGDCLHGHGLRSDDHVDPSQHLAHACRGWADLRHALDDAQQACREAYTSLSHLSTGPVPTSPGK
ncbi:hypothetical protein [Lentzea flava]|uniref:Excreted virulence factor EspC, type VII ESX diderm n=1 Tax=Lentzea flava TaxID=103732 RepID=A0ABQ2UD06_9PSEU|nr:hypothetical protein [Lentzea flava]MCP2197919.1 hypothetical protein [Lentzea flava]GGU23379.1 hypothetical protein GCM10010178_14390 [Lentzea flava]